MKVKIGFLQAIAQGAGTFGVNIVAAGVLPKTELAFFFVFQGLLLLPALFELGVSTVAIQLLAHGITGSGLSADFGRKFRGVSNLYRRISVAALIGMTAIGCSVLLIQHLVGVNYLAWVLCALAAAGLLALTPKLILLEASGNMVAIYFQRLCASVFRSMFMVLALLLGWGLFSIAVGGVVALLVSYVVASRFIETKSLRVPRSEGGDKDYKLGREFSGLAKLSSLAWIGGTLVFAFNNSIVNSAVHSAGAASFGFAFALLQGCVGVASVPVGANFAAMGRLIAGGDEGQARRLWIRQSAAASILYCVGAAVIYFILPEVFRRVGRDAPLLSGIDYFAGSVTCGLILLCGCIGSFIRAHRMELLAMPSIVAGIITPLFIYIGVRHSGVTGAAFGFLSSSVIYFGLCAFAMRGLRFYDSNIFNSNVSEA